MLPWVCVFGGLQRKIETVKMKEKKMKEKKLTMLKTNEKKMKSLGQKENQLLVLFNFEKKLTQLCFQLLALFSLFRKGGLGTKETGN
jgi:hypothetical protein